MRQFTLIGVPSNTMKLFRDVSNYVTLLNETADIYSYAADICTETSLDDGVTYPSDIVMTICRYNKFSMIVEACIMSYAVLSRDLYVSSCSYREIERILNMHNVAINHEILGGTKMTTEQTLARLEKAMMAVPVYVAQDVNKRLHDWFQSGGTEEDAYVLTQIEFLEDVAQSL